MGGAFVPLTSLSKPVVATPPPVVRPAPSRVVEGTPLFVGLDVGSTTVKAVVVNPADDKILWQDYQRHDTKQPEKFSNSSSAWKRKSASSAATAAFSLPAAVAAALPR